MCWGGTAGRTVRSFVSARIRTMYSDCITVFYRRPISLTPAQQLRLRTVAGAAVTALGPAE